MTETDKAQVIAMETDEAEKLGVTANDEEDHEVRQLVKEYGDIVSRQPRSRVPRVLLQGTRVIPVPGYPECREQEEQPVRPFFVSRELCS
jgi:hypothetical protein